MYHAVVLIKVTDRYFIYKGLEVTDHYAEGHKHRDPQCEITEQPPIVNGFHS